MSTFFYFFFGLCHDLFIVSSAPNKTLLSLIPARRFVPWMQSGSPQSWNVNTDKANVQFVKNKNKSGGARQAGSGQERLRQIPVPGQGKQVRGSKGSAKLHVPHELCKVRQGLWMITLHTNKPNIENVVQEGTDTVIIRMRLMWFLWGEREARSTRLRLMFLLNISPFFFFFLLTIHLNYKSVNTHKWSVSHFGIDSHKSTILSPTAACR